MTNFQDVLRDVHDAANHQLKTSASLSASTVYVGNPTLYAVVNTSASSGFATVDIRNTPTVFVGTPTLYAVVNTGGANTGNITLNPGPNFVGLVTAYISNAVGNATLNPSPNQIGSVTVSNPISIIGNLTINSGSISLVGNVTVYPNQYSFYQQASLVSGYVYYAFGLPGSNPTTSVFKIQRETLNSGEVLFADGVASFTKTWSAASLSSIVYS